MRQNAARRARCVEAWASSSSREVTPGRRRNKRARLPRAGRHGHLEEVIRGREARLSAPQIDAAAAWPELHLYAPRERDGPRLRYPATQRGAAAPSQASAAPPAKRTARSVPPRRARREIAPQPRHGRRPPSCRPTLPPGAALPAARARPTARTTAPRVADSRAPRLGHGLPEEGRIRSRLHARAPPQARAGSDDTEVSSERGPPRIQPANPCVDAEPSASQARSQSQPRDHEARRTMNRAITQ